MNIEVLLLKQGSKILFKIIGQKQIHLMEAVVNGNKTEVMRLNRDIDEEEYEIHPMNSHEVKEWFFDKKDVLFLLYLLTGILPICEK